MDQNFYQGKTALITGSGRGIGRAIALHFASLGSDIIVNYFRNRNSAEETAQEIGQLGVRVEIVKANVGEIDELEHLVEETDRIFGGLDFLISNAGSGYNRPIMEQRPKGWDWTMDINARALLFLAQKVVPLMDKRGAGWIVSISSPGSFRVLPEYAVVGASKAAVEALTRYLAVELAGRNIVVNAVSPGIAATEALQHFNTMQDEDLLDRDCPPDTGRENCHSWGCGRDSRLFVLSGRQHDPRPNPAGGWRIYFASKRFIPPIGLNNLVQNARPI